MSKKQRNRFQRTAQTPHEKFMLEMYRKMDEAITQELERLRTKGIVPTCKKGCHFCCRQVIYTNIPEAHAIGQHVRRNFSDHQSNELRTRTSNWFKWVELELPKHCNKQGDEAEAFYNYGPYCPLLIDGECSIYPVRPVTCRVHYVTSDSDVCRSYTDAQAVEGEVAMITAISYAVQHFAMRIRESIEATGVNFDDATLLLPQWLAMELGWKDLLPKQVYSAEP